jgi:hypothetical protein
MSFRPHRSSGADQVHLPPAEIDARHRQFLLHGPTMHSGGILLRRAVSLREELACNADGSFSGDELVERG